MRPKGATPKPVKLKDRHKPKLKRSLGLLEATVYGVGLIFGAGIYALIGQVAGIAGNAVWLAFVVAAALASFTALSYAELSSIFPKEAAEFVYLLHAFRQRSIAFIIGWLAIAAGIFAAATVSLAFAGYLSTLFPAPVVLIALVLIVILSLLNFWGIKESAKFNILFTAVETAGLLLIIFLALPFFGSVNYFEIPQTFGTGFMAMFAPILGAAALIFFAYLGFEDVVNVAEETRNPKKIIPKALIIALGFTTVIYILVSIAAVSVVNWQVLGESAAPLALVAETASGPIMYLVLVVIALFATLNTVLITLIVTSRMLYGMAAEGSMPKFFSKIHRSRCTPYFAVIAVMLAAMAFTLLGKVSVVASLTDFAVFIVFLMVNVAAIALRYKEPDAKRMFRMPVNIGKFPLLSLFGAAICVILLFNLIEPIHLFGYDVPILVFGLGLMAVGYIVYRILNVKH